MAQISHDSSCQPALLSIAGSLTIYEVRDVHGALIELLTADPSVSAWRLDLSELDELDSAGAQLLLAVSKYLRQAGIALETLNPQGAALELFELLRLNTLLPDAEPAQA